MASVWTAIPDSNIDPDSPFTTGLATAYRENVIAAFEKASGAPVLADDYIVNTMVGPDVQRWVELDTQTITSSTTSIDMDGFSSDYHRYKIVLTGVGRLTSSNIMYMRVKVAGSPRTDSQYSINGGSLTVQAAIGSPKTTAILAWNIEVEIDNPTNIINNKLLHVRVMGDTSIVNYHVSYQNETLVLSGLQFYTSGNGPFINGGLAKLYGLRN